MSLGSQVKDLKEELSLLQTSHQALREANQSQNIFIEDLKKRNQNFIQENQKLVLENKKQQTLIQWFKRQIFGQKSERRLAEVTGNQMMLGELPEVFTEVPPAEQTVKVYQRTLRKKKPLKGTVLEEGLRFSEDVPVKEIKISNPDIEGLHETDYEVISQKTTYRLAQKPGSYVVIKYVRDVVKIKETNKLISTPAPSAVLDKSYTDVSLLAGILVDKFRYHLPLYRQHQRLLDGGISISRGSLSNWVHQAVDLLEPIYYAQLSSVLQSKVLTMDETPIKASRSKGKMKTGYYWPMYGDDKEICFIFANTRSGKVIGDTLGSFCGTLQTDGYKVYESYVDQRKDITHALCWAHARRKFFEAQTIEPELCGHVLNQIQKLYAIEKDIKKRDISTEKKTRKRSESSKLVVEELFAWMKDQLQAKALLASNAFSKAAMYAIKREKGLKVFLDNPEVGLDTNHLEREIRAIAMGRKNWLFCWTEVGARYVGIAQSLIATCKLHNVDPYTYFVDVLQRIDTHKATDVHQLTPKLWKQHFQNSPLTSNI